MVEYRVQIKTKRIEGEIGEFEKILQNIGIKRAVDSAEELCYSFEKGINAGWGLLTCKSSESICLKLDQGIDGNPFGTAVYHRKGTLKDQPLESLILHFIMKDLFPADADISVQKIKAPMENDTSPIKSPTALARVNSSPHYIDSKSTGQQQQVENLKERELPQLPNRIESARLRTAKFDCYTDENGNLPVDTTSSESRSLIDYKIEIADPRSNRVIVQVMGVTFNDDYIAMNNEVVPDSLYFDFKFYKSQTITTDRAKVYLEKELPPQVELKPRKIEILYWPGILYRMNASIRTQYLESPGLALQFDVMKENAKSKPNFRAGSASFVYYMHQKELNLNIWDGDTLLRVGNAHVSLWKAIRQGRDAVSFETHVDILSQKTEKLAELTSSIGKLHIKITNIGYSSDLIGTETQNDDLSFELRNLVLPKIHTENIALKVKFSNR